MFIIEMNSVVTISELDERITAYYIMNVNNLENDDEEPSNNTLSKEMGYLGSVEATKKKLETLFTRYEKI